MFSTKILSSELNLAPNAQSAILIENSTGKIIYEKNIHEKRSPASMTKIMTLLLTMEALEKEIITYDTIVTVSKNASDMGGTQIFLEYGSNVDVLTLVKGIAIASANDAAVAIAEKIGGTKENFVNMMNNKAKLLGCKNTNFKNPHGLDEEEHYTTAYDLSLISRELLKYKDVLKFSSTYEDYITVSGENHWLVNTNKLVRFYEGIDGLKTGYTDKAKYCLTATMKKNDMRLISIVMKEETKEKRNEDTISMMEYGFSQYGITNILNTEDIIGQINISNSKNKITNYYLKEDVNIITQKNNRNVDYTVDKKIFSVKAPIKKNTKIGELTLSYDNSKYKYDLIVKEDIKKASFLESMLYLFNILNSSFEKLSGSSSTSQENESIVDFAADGNSSG